MMEGKSERKDMGHGYKKKKTKKTRTRETDGLHGHHGSTVRTGIQIRSGGWPWKTRELAERQRTAREVRWDLVQRGETEEEVDSVYRMASFVSWRVLGWTRGMG